MTSHDTEAKPKKPWYKRWWAIVLYVFIGMMIIGAINGGFDQDEYPVPDKTEAADATESEEPADDEEPGDDPEEDEPVESDEPEEAKEPEPASPEDQIESATDADNVEANYEEDSGVLFIQFDIADSMTKGLTTKGAQDDTVALLEAADDSGIDFDKVFIQGYFPMTDQYGETDDSMILNVGYTPSIIEQINFDNPTVRDTIWDIREQGMVHQELED